MTHRLSNTVPLGERLARSWLEDWTLPMLSSSPEIEVTEGWWAPFKHRGTRDRRRRTWTPWSAWAMALLSNGNPTDNTEYSQALKQGLAPWQALPAPSREALLRAGVRPGVTVEGLWGLVALASTTRMPKTPADPDWQNNTLPHLFRSLGDTDCPRHQRAVWQTLINLGKDPDERPALRKSLSTAYVALECRLARGSSALTFQPPHWALWAEVPHQMNAPLSWTDLATLTAGLKHNLGRAPLTLRMRWLTGVMDRLTPGRIEAAVESSAVSVGEAFLGLLKEGAVWPDGFALPPVLHNKVRSAAKPLADALRAHESAAALQGAVGIPEDGRPRRRM